jgi:hypothetical protein
VRTGRGNRRTECCTSAARTWRNLPGDGSRCTRLPPDGHREFRVSRTVYASSGTRV